MMNFAKTNALLQNDERFAEFIEKYRIELVIIFGSVAKNAKEAHDIDIAIQSKDQALPSQKLDLIYELSEFFSHDIDLTIININTDLLLLYEIVCGGKCIFERNDGMFLELKSLIW
jgi:predicted nucleotidyltransferase